MESDPSLRRWYLDYNRRYFQSKLPLNTVLYYESPAGDLGDCNLVQDSEEDEFLIRICPSIRFSRSMSKLTLLHEMVHLEQWHRKIKNPHGKLFQSRMLELATAGAFRKLW